LHIDRRGVGLLAAVFAAVAVVALAARGDHRSASGSVVDVPSSVTTGTQVAVAAIVGLLMLGVVLLAVTTVRQPRTGAHRRRSIAGPLIAIALLIVLVALRPHSIATKRERAPEVIDTREAQRSPAAGARRDEPAAWAMGALGVTLLLAVAGGAVVLARRRRSAGHAAVELPRIATPEARASAVDAALAEVDPRTAVLLAFQAAEAVLSADDSTRRPLATSAREWAAIVGSPHLDRLVSRYEIARFSHHAVTEDDRAIAVGALRALA
jgi:hypothetical protein